MSSKKASSPSKTTTAKTKTRQFQVGDLAVYPAHGVGKIEAIETRVINGEKLDFYKMKVLENNMLIMIPTRNVESVGLRDVIDKKEISMVYDVIKSK
jgi:CarD family transcriptional regulator